MSGSRSRPPVLAVSGPSGSGKTRLLARLIPALARRGVSVAVLKHTRHAHPFDRFGKDTDVLRRAGAIAAAIQGPHGMAWFGPPAGGLRELVRRLPPVDLVLAEGFREAAVPRLEVHRRRVSREFLCETDRRVFAVVTDERPPRAVPAFAARDIRPIASAVCARFGLGVGRRRQARLRVQPIVSSVRAKRSERTALGKRNRMAKTTNRKSGSRAGARRGGGRSAAGRKGGNATLRARGPEFYSEIGRKGGKRRGKAAAARTRKPSPRSSVRSRAGGSRSKRRSSGR